MVELLLGPISTTSFFPGVIKAVNQLRLLDRTTGYRVLSSSYRVFTVNPPPKKKKRATVSMVTIWRATRARHLNQRVARWSRPNGVGLFTASPFPSLTKPSVTGFLVLPATYAHFFRSFFPVFFCLSFFLFFFYLTVFSGPGRTGKRKKLKKR